MATWVHRDIHAALVARDPGRAREAIEAHYRHAEERLFAGFEAPQTA
jgi:DNA-binding FadR family transcriptional regulator